MAPASRQRTFELIPDAPLGPQRVGNDPSPIFSKPPMTTKQAKKLHNQKTKGPKLSKAEQRRIELMEQDRIRKEFEKEKAQARARAARDKKKAKEDKEKEERKRKGLPLKDIHPSQDTISRFLNRAGLGLGKKHDLTVANAPLDTVDDGDSDTLTGGDESMTDAGDDEENDFDKENQAPAAEGDPQPQKKYKRMRLSPPEDFTTETRSPVMSQHQIGPMARLIQESAADSYSRTSSAGTDDPINETLLENQLLADIVQASSRLVASRGSDEDDAVTVLQPRDPATLDAPVPSASNKPSEHSQLQPTMEPPERITTSVTKAFQPPDTRAAPRYSSHLGAAAFKKPTSPYVRPRPPTKTPTLPNGPPKFKSPIVRQENSTERLRFLPRHLNPAQHRQFPAMLKNSEQPNAHGLPASTQAFLFDHADELFPSATQEAKEVAGNIAAESPRLKVQEPRLSVNGPMYRSGAASLSRPHPVPRPTPSESAVPTAGMSFDYSCLSTQDLMISTQDLLDIDTPSKAVTRAPISTTDKMRPPRNATRAIAEDLAVRMPNDNPELQRQTSVNRSIGKATAADVAADGSRGSHPSTRHSQGQNKSCSSSHKLPSQQLASQRLIAKGTITDAASHTPRSSYQRHATVVQQRSNPDSSKNSTSAPQVPSVIATPKNPPPKKRMFGSSGPGAEALVAMERSHREMLREQKKREEQLRAQERLAGVVKPPAEQLDLNLSQFADELLDDSFGLSFEQDSFGGQGPDPTTKDTASGNAEWPKPDPAAKAQVTQERHPVSTGGEACPAASQETDYGNFDDLDMDLLEEATSWVDEDLVDF